MAAKRLFAKAMQYGTARVPGPTPAHQEASKFGAIQILIREWSVVLLIGSCLALLPAGCAARTTKPAPQPLADTGQGKTHFNNYCSACHQYDSEGMGEAPPLDDSPWVTGPERRLIRIVMHGVRGPMEIHGKLYNREMPGFGQILSDAEIAALLSFVRERFGPSPPITEATVASVRAANEGREDYWSVEELLEKP